MRSKTWLWIGLSCTAGFLGNCDQQAERIDDICDTLLDCSQYASGLLRADEDKEACRKQLKDALSDRRLTPTQLTRCASCTSAHAPDPREPRVCEDLLTDRDCDSACADVSFVLDSRTTREARQRMCRALESDGCGIPQSFGNCDQDIERAFAVRLDFEARLALDIEVRRCADCVAPRALEVSDASVERLDAGEFDIDSCDRILDNCTSACSQVSRLSARLNRAQAAITYCNKVQGCSLTPEVVATQSLPTADCFERALAVPAALGRQLEGCAGCAEAQLDCSSVNENCAECAPLQRAEAIAQTCREASAADPSCATMTMESSLEHDAEALRFCSRLPGCSRDPATSARVALSASECYAGLLRLASWSAVTACDACLASQPECPAEGTCNDCRKLDDRLQLARARTIFCDQVRACDFVDAGPSRVPLAICNASDDETDADTDAAAMTPEREALLQCSSCAQANPGCPSIRANCPASCVQEAL